MNTSFSIFAYIKIKNIMEIYKVLNSHRSIRKYKPNAIPDDIINKIIEVGFRASNTGNMQLYSIIITQDKKLKQELWEIHFKQNMILEAPVIMTFCADINRFNKWCKLRNAEPGYDNFLWFYSASIDAILVSQNISIAAEAEGLGICYLGTTIYQAQKIIDVLKLPKGVVPVTTIVIGYPDENPDLVDRLPKKGIVHYEVYKDYSDDDINDIYSYKESLPETLALLQQNNLPNLARIFTERRYVKKDNVYFSKEYLKVIDKQGFMNNND